MPSRPPGGYTYAQMGRFEAKPNTPQAELAEGGGTSNEEFAVIDPESGRPTDNSARDIWVTATALSTALNTSYMADRLSVFGIVGIALLLTGIGFGLGVSAPPGHFYLRFGDRTSTSPEKRGGIGGNRRASRHIGAFSGTSA